MASSIPGRTVKWRATRTRSCVRHCVLVLVVSMTAAMSTHDSRSVSLLVLARVHTHTHRLSLRVSPPLPPPSPPPSHSTRHALFLRDDESARESLRVGQKGPGGAKAVMVPHHCFGITTRTARGGHAACAEANSGSAGRHSPLLAVGRILVHPAAAAEAAAAAIGRDLAAVSERETAQDILATASRCESVARRLGRQPDRAGPGAILLTLCRPRRHIGPGRPRARITTWQWQWLPLQVCAAGRP